MLHTKRKHDFQYKDLYCCCCCLFAIECNTANCKFIIRNSLQNYVLNNLLEGNVKLMVKYLLNCQWQAIFIKYCQAHMHSLTEQNVYSTLNTFHLTCGAGATRGVGEGREKNAKEGKREGSACYKSWCFCIPSTIFLTNPITSTVNKGPITCRGLLSMVWN